MAVAAMVWLPIWGLMLAASQVPTVWKWALAAYGGYGMFESIATLSENREAWARKLVIARVGSLTLLGVLVVYQFATTAG